jgi:uncharacterized DUF497 family protein
MEFEWDEDKDGAELPDLRQPYGEPRYRVCAFIGDRLCFCAHALRNGRIRVISLRKANARGVRDHGR